MPRPSKKRRQREQKWIEEQLAEDGHKREAEGSFWVLDCNTGEKTPSLNLKQAKELWRKIGNAKYFTMDTYKAGLAPLKALFNAGKLP